MANANFSKRRRTADVRLSPRCMPIAVRTCIYLSPSSNDSSFMFRTLNNWESERLAHENSRLRNSCKVCNSTLPSTFKQLLRLWNIQLNSHHFSSLYVNLTACVFRTKGNMIHYWVSVLETTREYVVSKCHELWSTNGLKLDRSFYPPSVNSAFHFIAKLRRRKSVNGTQPNFAKRRTVNRANNLP